MFHVIVNVYWMAENIIQIKCWIKVCVNVSLKIQPIIMYSKEIMFVILIYVLVKLIDICKVIFNYSVITGGEIRDTSEAVPKTFNFKKATLKTDYYLSLHFFYKWPHCHSKLVIFAFIT